MKNIIFALTSVFIAYLPCAINAQETPNNEVFTFEATYIGDNVNNLLGGIKTGSRYLGMANIRLSFDAEKGGLWKGGQFYLNAANTHGKSPSSDLLGDIQVATNIDGGNHTYIQELWFKQMLGKVEITAGLQDLNVEFANSASGALYLNSSFGILPVISNNITPPIFPLTALGITAKWSISEKTTLVSALYDGSPTDFDYNPYNVKWEFISGDGLLAISEFKYNTIVKNQSGIYKIGGFAHSHIVEDLLNKNIPDSLNQNIFGVYFYIDQEVWHCNNKNVGLFSQIGYSPSRSSNNDIYLGLGINYNGLFSKNGSDILGLAIAHEHFTDGMKSETAIELSYQYQINKNIFIQPDIQYIINPAGTGKTLNNAFAAILRFGFSF